MVKKLLLTIVLAFILLAASVMPAWAMLTYGLGEIDMTISNPANPFPDKYYWTGTRAWNQVTSYHPTEEQINSVYMKQESPSFQIVNEFEFGWKWDTTVDPYSPHYYVSVWKNGFSQSIPSLGAVAAGSNHLFRIQVDQATAYFNVDSNPTNNEYDYPANFPIGLSVSGAERSSAGDSDYSHFWGLQKRNAAWSYGYWQNLQTYSDDDPSYGVQKISGSNTNVQTVYFPYQPFYRLYNGRDHFYTMSEGERWSVLYPSVSYTYENTACEMANSGDSYAVNFYRSFNPTSGDHFYTTSWTEAHTAGYNYEEVAAYIYSRQVSGSIPLYRSYNPTTGDHFYTTSWTEANASGYNYEQVAGYVMILF